MSLSTNAACRTLRASGLDAKVTHQILSELQRWVSCNGYEWTIKRLKSFKMSYIHMLAKQFDLADEDLAWVKHGSKGPKGPFGAIFKLGKPQKVLSALMVYTHWTSPVPTKSQLAKFYDAAEMPNKWRAFPNFTRASLETVAHASVMRPHFSNIHSYLDRNIRVPVYVEKSVRSLTESSRMGSTHRTNLQNLHPKDRIEVVQTAPISVDNFTGSAWQPAVEEWFNKVYSDLPDDIYALISKGAIEPSSSDYPFVGRISHLQEPGFKLRVIANPMPVYQIALSRLGNVLYDTLSTIREDCTFDQGQGVKDIQEMMKTGTHFVSLDLSNATDSFPLDFTIAILKQILPNGLDDDLELFKKVSRGRFYDPYNGKGYTQWTKGQPLGLFPSFAAFAISHHVIIPKGAKYRILGDDLVIERRYADILLARYDCLGLKVSNDKSINSQFLTEFAGRLITKDKVYVQPKFRTISDRSFLELIRNIGPRALGMLRPRQKRVAKAFSEIPLGLHPFALGWNPKGLPYSVRLENCKHLLSTLKQSEFETYSSPTARILRVLKTQILYSQSGEFHINLEPKGCQPFADVEVRVLEQAGVTSVESDRPPKDWSLGHIPTSDPRGPTTLEVAERQIRIADKARVTEETQLSVDESQLPNLPVSREANQLILEEWLVANATSSQGFKL